MKYLKVGSSVILLTYVLLACTSKTAVPTEQAHFNWVMDQADLLSASQEDSIATLSRQLEAEIGSQVAVLIIQSLDGEKIEEYSLKAANAMKLGRASHDDGVLITISTNDHRVRIEVGEGLEYILKDEIAARLIREDMAPRFAQGNYGDGLYVVVEKIAGLIRENQQLIGK